MPWGRLRLYSYNGTFSDGPRTLATEAERTRDFVKTKIALLLLILAPGCFKEQTYRAGELTGDVRNYVRHQTTTAPYLADGMSRYLSYQVELAGDLTADVGNFARHQIEDAAYLEDAVNRYIKHEAELANAFRKDFLNYARHQI